METYNSSNVTLKDFEGFIKVLSERADRSKTKPEMIFGGAALKNLYNELGVINFKIFVESIQLLTNVEGINFIDEIYKNDKSNQG